MLVCVIVYHFLLVKVVFCRAQITNGSTVTICVFVSFVVRHWFVALSAFARETVIVPRAFAAIVAPETHVMCSFLRNFARNKTRLQHFVFTNIVFGAMFAIEMIHRVISIYAALIAITRLYWNPSAKHAFQSPQTQV
jgi:hypothetical protein